MDFIHYIDFIEDKEDIKEFSGVSIYDAFIYTYQLYEEINLEEISRLTSSSIKDVVEALDEHIFLDPVLFDCNHDLYHDYILDIHYLMGNLYDKYKQAYLMNIKYGGLFEKNLRFLKKYIPDISIKQMVDAKSLFHDEIKDIYQYFHTHQYRYKKNLNMIALLEDSDLLYKNSNIEIHTLMYEYINIIKKNKGYKHLMGYTLTSFDHDPFYMMLMNKKNIIVETDVEKRIYTLLLSACSLLLHDIKDEVTIIVNANVKRILLDLKHQLYPNLKGIHIICAHEFKGDEECIIYDCSSSYIRKIVAYMSTLSHCSFFLDNLVDHHFIEDFVYYFINEEERVYKKRYENGYIIPSVDYNSLSFMWETYHDCFRLFQQLSPYLTFHASDIHAFSLKLYDNKIHHLDARLCKQHDAYSSHSKNELYKERMTLSLLGDLNEVKENSKYQKIIENIYLYSCYEYKYQLVYCDHYDLKKIKEDLFKIGLNKNDIQIITPRTTLIKDCKVYLSKTNNIYPFQIKDIEAIHHIDIPDSLHHLYSRNQQVKQYLYITKKSIDCYKIQKLFYDALIHDEYHRDFTLSKKLYSYFLASLSHESYLTNKYTSIQTRRLEDKFFMIDTKYPLINFDCIQYPLLNLQHITRHQKQVYEKIIKESILNDYFNQKERYVCTLGCYQVFLPKNMIKEHPYLLLISNRTFIYPIKNTKTIIKDLIQYLKDKENQYEENEYRSMSNHVREAI